MTGPTNPAEVVDVLLAIMDEEQQSNLVVVLDGLPSVSCDDVAKEIRRRKAHSLRRRVRYDTSVRADPHHRAQSHGRRALGR
jgi:hypothetical protein